VLGLVDALGLRDRKQIVLDADEVDSSSGRRSSGRLQLREVQFVTQQDNHQDDKESNQLRMLTSLGLLQIR
jgi:hypothetical protein